MKLSFLHIVVLLAAQEYWIHDPEKLLITRIKLRRSKALLLHEYIRNNSTCPTLVTGWRITIIYDLKAINCYLNVNFFLLLLFANYPYSTYTPLKASTALKHHCTSHSLGHIKCSQRFMVESDLYK